MSIFFASARRVSEIDTSAFSWGTVVGAWFEAVDDGKTKVTVVTKRRYQLGITTDLSEDTFHERFAQAVAIVERGHELPSSPPN